MAIFVLCPISHMAPLHGSICGPVGTVCSPCGLLVTNCDILSDYEKVVVKVYSSLK